MYNKSNKKMPNWQLFKNLAPYKIDPPPIVRGW